MRARCVCLKEGGGVRFKREEKNWWFAQSSRGTRVLESVRAQNGEVLLRRPMPKMLRVHVKPLTKQHGGCVFPHPAFGKSLRGTNRRCSGIPKGQSSETTRKTTLRLPARRPSTCRFSENRRAKLIKNSDGALCGHPHRDTRCDLGTLPLAGHDGIRAGMRSGSAIKSGERDGYLSGVL